MATLFIINPIALRKAKIVHNFGLSECNRVDYLLIRTYLIIVLFPDEQPATEPAGA